MMMMMMMMATEVQKVVTRKFWAVGFDGENVSQQLPLETGKDKGIYPGASRYDTLLPTPWCLEILTFRTVRYISHIHKYICIYLSQQKNNKANVDIEPPWGNDIAIHDLLKMVITESEKYKTRKFWNNKSTLLLIL